MSTDNTALLIFAAFVEHQQFWTSRVSKQQRPGYIIPFSKTKEDCKQAYKKMVTSRVVCP